jgi:hypothetical protein
MTDDEQHGARHAAELTSGMKAVYNLKMSVLTP